MSRQGSLNKNLFSLGAGFSPENEEEKSW